jgi:hypothetical protein
MAKSTRCMADVGNTVKEITVKDALNGLGANYRCIRCKGQVSPHRKGSNGAAAHFEHVNLNHRSSCPLSHYYRRSK